MNASRQDAANYNALENPQVGDYWTERIYCPYFLVVNVQGPKITVLSCLGGEHTFNRKHEPNARVENADNTWSFDYSKSMIVNREWMERAVKYGSIEGFVADVQRNEKTLKIAEEWAKHRAEQLLKELEDLGPIVSKYLLERQ